jgi:hypothetical protein
MSHMPYSLNPVNIYTIHVTKFLEFHAFQPFVTAAEYKFLFNEVLMCVSKLLVLYRLMLKFTLFSPHFLHVTVISLHISYRTYYEKVFGQLTLIVLMWRIG